MKATNKLAACARYAETSAADYFGLVHVFKTSKRDDIEVMFIPVTAETDCCYLQRYSRKSRGRAGYEDARFARGFC